VVVVALALVHQSMEHQQQEPEAVEALQTTTVASPRPAAQAAVDLVEQEQPVETVLQTQEVAAEVVTEALALAALAS